MNASLYGGLQTLTCDIWEPGHGGSVHFLATARPGIPAFNGSIASGLSPWWLFGYFNGTTINVPPFNETVVLAVVVVNGTATALATVTSIFYEGIPLGSVGVPAIGSPAAVAAAVASNSSFFSSHPDLNVTFGPMYKLIPGMTGWYWYVTFTTCAPFAQWFGEGSTSYNGVQYGVILNATSGSLVGASYPTTTVCSSTG